MANILAFGTYKNVGLNSDHPEPWIKPLDAETSAISLVSSKPIEGWSLFGHAGFGLGLPVRPETVPTRARRTGAGLSHYPKLDVDKMEGWPILTQAVKDLIESIEPGVHQFFPVTVAIGSEDAPYGEYFLFNACQRLDTIDRTLSGPFNAHGMCRWPDADNSSLVLDSNRIKGHHFWTEKFLPTSGWIFASEKMTEAPMNSGLTGVYLSNKVDETAAL